MGDIHLHIKGSVSHPVDTASSQHPPAVYHIHHIYSYLPSIPRDLPKIYYTSWPPGALSSAMEAFWILVSVKNINFE
jgi:hypothetical protein